jgi:hypothetical protein
VRALRLRGTGLAEGLLVPAYETAASALPHSTQDRPLDGDLAIAQELLPALAALA